MVGGWRCPYLRLGGKTVQVPGGSGPDGSEPSTW